jgi:hypothetical protein
MKPTMSARLVSSLVLVGLTTRGAYAQPAGDPPAPPASTTAPADAAQSHVDAAMALYAAADLAGALDELTKALAIDPRPDILFGIARIHMERGDCVNAMRAYRTYLESRPGPNSTQVATEAIESCQKILSAMGDQTIATEPDGDARGRNHASSATASLLPAREPAPVQRRVNRGWYRDRVGGALVAGAALGFAGGGALWLSARSDIDRANQRGTDGVTLAEAHDREDAASRKQRWSLVAGSAGAALLIGGVLRYALADHTDTIELSPPPSGAGATVTVGWRF